jgi:hypothetical protein
MKIVYVDDEIDFHPWIKKILWMFKDGIHP